MKELYREINFTKTPGRYYLYSRIRTIGGREGFLPSNFLRKNRKAFIGKKFLTRHGSQQQLYIANERVIHIREKPDLHAQILTSLRLRDEASIIYFSERGLILAGQLGKWAFVQTREGVIGWVFSAFLSPGNVRRRKILLGYKPFTKKVSIGSSYYPILDYTNIYEYPTPFSTIVAKLPKASPIKVKSIYSGSET
ncbi:MAG: SH3 domain-containing protein, partial [Spirochaetota bacterium]